MAKRDIGWSKIASQKRVDLFYNLPVEKNFHAAWKGLASSVK